MPESASFWDSLPSGPGIYIFEDAARQPLYIGKSIDLKTRFKQHFEGFKQGTTKAAQFIPQTRSLYFKPVRNDIEAIIVEANLIKTYQPRYNSAVKDDKTNLYFVFTNPPDTKIRLVHATDIVGLHLDHYAKQVYGPYTSGQAAGNLLKQIRRIFGICQQPFNSRQRACFNYHLGFCPGACTGQISAEKYQRHLGKIKRFLSGKFTLIDKSLHREINQAIRRQQFELAARIRDQIYSLHHALSAQNSSLLLKLSDVSGHLQYQIVKTLKHPRLTHPPYRIECFDLAHLQGDQYVGSMAVFIRGEASPENYRHFNIRLPDRSDPHAMKQILTRRLSHPEWGTPDLIVLDGGVPQLSTVISTIPSQIPVVSLAKKRETLYFYGSDQKIISLSLQLEDPVLNLFRSLRDEAHRLANSFHRRKRQKALLA